MMKQSRSLALLWLAVPWLVWGRGLEASTSTTALAPWVTEFVSDVEAVRRALVVPWSEESIDREEALLGDWRRRVEAIDFEGLDADGRMDWLLFNRHLEAERARLILERRQLLELAEALPFRHELQRLQQGRWQQAVVDPAAMAGVLDGALTSVKDVRRRVQEGRDGSGPKNPAPVLVLSPVMAIRTALVIDDLHASLREWFSFYDGFVPEFSWWVRRPYQALETGLDDYAKYLRTEVAGLKGEPDDPLLGEPAGAPAIAQQIAAEWIPQTADELIAVGERELAWCEVEMRKAAAEMGLGDDVAAALAKIKTLHVAPGAQPALVTQEAERAIAFIKERSLLTIPPLCEETWRLAMLTPEAQKTLPYAVYSSPRIMVAYAHEAMDHEDKMMSMRGNNQPSLHLVTPHELIPGHHLQGFMAQRHQPHRQRFATPFFVEGWALHWEMRFWDLAYSKTPEERLGMLFWRRHRCARIIVSLNFHLGRTTPGEMVDFLVTRIGHEKTAATSEVRRYINGSYSPLYQAAYMIGGLQLRALHHEIVGGGHMTEHAFHDAVLTHGPVPIALIRARLLDETLTRDWKPARSK